MPKTGACRVLRFENSARSLLLDQAQGNILRALEIHSIGTGAIRVQHGSTGNSFYQNFIHHTGLSDAQSGIGIELGTAYPANPGAGAGNSDKAVINRDNRIESNLFGPGVSAAAIRFNADSARGLIRNNTFISVPTVSASWINIDGSGHQVHDNQGAYHHHTPPGLVQKLLSIDGPGRDKQTTAIQARAAKRPLEAPYFAEGTYAGLMTLLLPARELPYTLSELIARHPRLAVQLDREAVALESSVLAGPGATLRISELDTRQLRLRSDSSGHIALAAYTGRLDLHGSREKPLVINSWDATSGETDRDISNGRAYVLQLGGRMDISPVQFSHLGYEEGNVSGVAWKSTFFDGRKQMTTGDVSHPTFSGNHFGAYTYEARDMNWQHNGFHHNVIYGFDPHDFSNNITFERNLASHNGSHGIIFSRGCDDNLIRFNHAFNNAGHGIMIDDGKVIPDSPLPRWLYAIPSNRNVIEHNILTDNKDGVVIEGGAGNVVRNNLIAGTHRYGIRLNKAAIHSDISNNTLEHARRAALFVYNGSNHNLIRDNRSHSARRSILLHDSRGNRILHNQFRQLQLSAAQLKGDLSATVFSNDVFRGRGREDFQSVAGTDVDIAQWRRSNDLSHWLTPVPSVVAQAGLGVWCTALLLPLILWPFQRLKRGSGIQKAPDQKHPAPPQANVVSRSPRKRRATAPASPATLEPEFEN